MRWLILQVSLATILLGQQGATGTIGGTITDIDGRAVPRIPVQATNAATNAVYRATASATGEYSISQLPAGTYQLTVQAPAVAFKPFVRDNLQVAAGKTLRLDIRLEEGFQLNTLGDGRDFFASIPRPVPPSGATPRMSDGRPDLSGYWSQGGGAGDPGAAPQPPELTDWARSLAKERQANDFRDFPSVRCLPNGVVFAITVGFAQRIVQTPTLMVMLSEGQPTRQVFLDGRSHPNDPNPTWLGHSVGRWEGETLIVDSVGFNDKTWLDLNGYPHTEMLHVVERYHRTDLGHLELDLSVIDPGALKSPWRLQRVYSLNPKEDVLESICTENEKDAAHMANK
jgi:hypothetical protein